MADAGAALPNDATAPADTERSPCQSCGACCAAFRVSFYWRECDDSMGGWVPVALTARLDTNRRAMRGTLAHPVRCVALKGELGQDVSCGIYVKRPSPCREFDARDEQGRVNERCTQARAGIGLPALVDLSD